jgi:hypothetical protein
MVVFKFTLFNASWIVENQLFIIFLLKSIINEELSSFPIGVIFRYFEFSSIFSPKFKYIRNPFWPIFRLFYNATLQYILVNLLGLM